MKILEAFGEPFSYGGQEAFVMNVLDHMDRSGVAADLLTPYYADNIASERVEEYGGKVYSLGCRFNPGGIRLNTVRPIRQFLRSRHYDVIHIHSGSNSMLAVYARLAHEAGIRRIIVHSHSTGISGPKHIAAKTLTSGILSRFPTDYCACSSEAGEWRFPAKICRGRLKVITDGINPDHFRFNDDTRKRIRNELGVDEGTVLIGCAGRLAVQKNQTFLVDLLRDIIRAAGRERDYRLLLVGGGELFHTLRKQADTYGLSDRVLMTGVRDNIEDYYQAMDVLAVPSLYEGFGMVIVEGQAAGLEVIASDTVPRAAGITDSVAFLPLADRDAWLRALMKPHSRHAENADAVRKSEYNIYRTAETVRNMYLKEY